MREADFDPFLNMLDDVAALLNHGKPLTSGYKSMFFRAMAEYSLAEVQSAFDGHAKDPARGHFMPAPANLIAQIVGAASDDGRPGADEAWAMSLCAQDEADTVVWTAEMAQAWGIAQTVLRGGDEVGARMAYRDAYNRLVGAARGLRAPPVWDVSLGFDPQRRDLALERAVRAGRLPITQMPRLAGPGDQLLLGGDLANNPDVPPHALEAIDRLRQIVNDRASRPGADGAAKVHTQELKAEAALRVENYVKERA